MPVRAGDSGPEVFLQNKQLLSLSRKSTGTFGRKRTRRIKGERYPAPTAGRMGRWFTSRRKAPPRRHEEKLLQVKKPLVLGDSSPG